MEEIVSHYRRTIRWRGKRMVVTWNRYAYLFTIPAQKYTYFSKVCDPLDWSGDGCGIFER